MRPWRQMDIQQEVEAIKKELVDLIVVHLRENKIDEQKARQLAADFLAVLPISTQRDLLEKLKSLGTKYPEAQELYVKELREVSDQQREQVLLQMRDCIKEGNMEQAIIIARTVDETGGATP